MRDSTKMAMVLLTVLCALMTSCELPRPWVTVFSDDFNRTNSDAVGNGWGEISPGGVPAGNAEISVETLLMMGGNSLQKYMAIVRSQAISGDFRITFSLSFPDVPTFVYVYVTTAAMDY